MSTASRIFTGYRALGFVSNHIPLQVRHHNKHKEDYVITCVGKVFHTYNCSKLGIAAVSDAHPSEIECLAVDAFRVFTSCGNVIRAFERAKQVHIYEGHSHNVHLLLPFGDHLISVDTESHMIIWDITSEGIYLEMSFDNNSFQITSVVHPNTYLNKILLGSKNGALQLWNIKSAKLLFTFKGWDTPITILEQAPAVDVIAVGLADGHIILHNIRYDETLVKFKQDWGAVTTLSFRTDGHPIMATGSAVGHIALWDLEERKLKSQMRDAHNSTITGMQCLPSQPLMVTSSPDNSLKVWIFDLADGGGRLLRERSGHSAPPNRLQHYGNNGQNILSAGQDSTLRSFSVLHDKHNKSLGRASFHKAESKRTGLKHDQHMMPPITDFSSDPTRQSDWDNIVACHRNLCLTTTWSYQRSTMGRHKFHHERFKSSAALKNTIAQCSDISSCGNFVVIGYSSGHIDMYNLQSGLFRGTYGDPSAHNCPIRGVVIDGINQTTISADASGTVKFWKFKKKDLLDSLKLEGAISQLKLHRESSMLAVSLDDFRVVIIDIDTRKIVRRFTGHYNRVTDMTFSSDARWLITSSMDSTVRTWDLPSGRLVDCFLLDAAVTSLSMSSTGDFLATSHIDDVGVYLWSNKTLYTHVSLRPLPADYVSSIMEMPGTRVSVQGNVEQEDEDTEEVYEVSDFKSPEQIADELVTLSLLPNSRWQNLLNLDIIKKRNKPRQPPKVPKSAPFFLPTIAGLEPKFEKVEDDRDKKKETSSKPPGSFQPLSDLGKLLINATTTDDYDPVMNMFKELGPSTIDLEIRSLSPDNGGSMEVMCQFLKFIHMSLETNKNFELCQAYLALFLQVHGEVIASNEDLCSCCERLLSELRNSWNNLQDLFTQNLCLINYLRSATI